METLFVLVGLLFVVAPVAGLLVALGTRHRLILLETRVTQLSNRVDGLASEIAQPIPREAAPPERPPVAEDVAPTPVPSEPSTTETISEPARSEPEPAAASAASGDRAQPQAGSVPPIPPQHPPLSLADFEQRFGTKWVVWIGGVSLALGGIFLVRYSIERGLIGPGVRIALGALLAAVLLVLGEGARRKEMLTGLTGLPRANIPAVLTAAGTTVAYATIYAAYALYGFLSPGAAFILLGVVAVATLAAALLHGPALGGLGVVGAYLTPMLVTSAQPNYWALYVYLAVVGAAALTLARARLWLWLAATAIVFGALWTLPGLAHWPVAALVPHLFHVIAYYVLLAVLVVAGLLYGPQPPPGRTDPLSSLGLSAFLLMCLLVVVASRHDPAALTVFTLLVIATVVIAWCTEAAIAAVPAAALLATLLVVKWAVAPIVDFSILPGGPVAGVVPEPPRFETSTHLVLSASYAALFGLSGFAAQGRSRPPISIVWAVTAAATPLALLIALYYRLTHFEPSMLFAGVALGLAGLNAVATEALIRRALQPGVAAASAIFAVGSIAALALAFTFALEKGWLTIALALMAPGIAWVSEQRPLPFLRRVAAIVIAIVSVRVAMNPYIVAARDLGTTPIFNWLLYGYGVPALSFCYAAQLLRRRADDEPTRIAEAGAVLFTALLVFFELRHWLNAGEILRPGLGLAELALDVTFGIVLAAGLDWISQRTTSIVYQSAARLIGIVTLIAIVLGLFLSKNPMVTGESVGGPFFNLILLGYGLPLVLVAGVALYFRPRLSDQLRWVAAITTVALALFYLTLEVRTLYHGPVLTIGQTTQAEQYTYSVVWLVFGIVLLAPGVLLRSLPLRLASLAVILLTIGKVFLYDLSSLTGAYRAFSFIGLGLVLVGIGWLYQKVLFPPRPATASPATTPAT